jgi:hypothetical protein
VFPDVSGMMARIEKSFSDNLEVLVAICRTLVRTGRVLEQEYGIPGMNAQDTRLAARSLSRMPVVLEGTLVARETFDLEEKNRNIVPSRGFYSNIGDDAFQVTLEGLEGDGMQAHTVPPGVTIAITYYVTKITILPLTGTAKYQVLVQ